MTSHIEQAIIFLVMLTHPIFYISSKNSQSVPYCLMGLTRDGADVH